MARLATRCCKLRDFCMAHMPRTLRCWQLAALDDTDDLENETRFTGKPSPPYIALEAGFMESGNHVPAASQLQSWWSTHAKVLPGFLAKAEVFALQQATLPGALRLGPTALPRGARPSEC